MPIPSPVLPPEVIEDRQARFKELGFTDKESRRLVDAIETSTTKNRRGEEVVFETPLRPSVVKDALANGCNHVMAIRLFT